MKDYKTTIAGLIGAIAFYISNNPQQFDPRVTAIAKLVEVLGVGFLGVLASDAKLGRSR